MHKDSKVTHPRITVLPEGQNLASLLKARLILLSSISYSSCCIVLCWGSSRKPAPASLVWLFHLPPLFVPIFSTWLFTQVDLQ